MNKDTKEATGNQKAPGNNAKYTQGSTRKGAGRYTSTFKGETSDMNGKVFQLLSEQPKRNQFEDTLEALQRYADKTYPLDSVFLLPLFKDLTRPVVKQPSKPFAHSPIGCGS